ncbi:MAG: type II toxin-antitoxin system ParD family antitoxin [Janthinobacterium lividum]
MPGLVTTLGTGPDEIPTGPPSMPTRKTMNVSITPELERSVAARVAAGRYRTASEVVRAALRMLDREEPLDGTRPSAQHGERDDHVGPNR